MTATTTPRVVVQPGSRTASWGSFDGRRRPVASVAEGDAFEIATLNACLADCVPDEPSAEAVRAMRSSDTPAGPGPHIVTGPVEVRGVQAGAALAVDLHEISVDADHGVNQMRPGGGLLTELLSDADVAVLAIDRSAGSVLVPPGVHVALRPFFGIMATAPAPELGRLDTVPPHRNGGNIDCKEMVAGSRLLLPTAVDGAGLLVGDGHGAQGDGEVCQTAVETALRGVLSAGAVPSLDLEAPVGVTATHLITFGFHENLLTASEDAVTALIDLLVRACGVRRNDAYRLCGLAADLRVTQVVNRTRGVHAMIPRKILDQLGPPDWVRCPADEWPPG